MWIRPRRKVPAVSTTAGASYRRPSSVSDPGYASALDDERRRGPLGKRQSALPLQQRAHRAAIQPTVALRPRGSNRRPLRPVEHPELNARQVGRPPHDAAERIDFAHDGPLGDPADGGIARHLPDGFEILREEERARPGAAGECRRLRARVSGTDHDDVVPVGHAEKVTGRGRKIPSGTADREFYLSAFAPTRRAMPYKLKINRSLCTGYAECVGIAPEVFQLGADNVVLVVDPEAADDETVLDAARACPVDAITAHRRIRRPVWPHSGPIQVWRLGDLVESASILRHLMARHDGVRVFRTYAELGAPPQKFVLCLTRRRGVVHRRH